MIPSVFAQVKLRSDNAPLVLTTTDTEDLEVLMQIPLGSYGTIIEDVNPTLDGIQVPVYGFNYRWYYVGNATLVEEDTNNAGESPVGTLQTLADATSDLVFMRKLAAAYLIGCHGSR